MKKFIIFTIGIWLVYSLYTGKIVWNHCNPQAGLINCWRLNPIVLPALIIMTALTIIVVVDTIDHRH